MKIKYIDKTMDKIKYATEGSVGLDVYSREDCYIGKHSFGIIPLNIVVETPKGYMTGLLPRSSLFKKKGLILANSIGVIDQDYCGENDEIRACLVNLTDDVVYIKKGEIICQLVSFRVDIQKLEEVEMMNNNDRGGFGSTDKKNG